MIAHLVLVLQAATSLPVVPSEPPVSEATWECLFVSEDRAFVLQGQMPSFRHGWSAQAASFQSDSPSPPFTESQVSVVAAGDEYRRYRVSAESDDGTQYTMALIFLDEEDGLGWIDQYKYQTSEGKVARRLIARANYCRSSFAPSQIDGAGQ